MARPLVLASSKGATTGPAAGQAQVMSSSFSCAAAGCGVAAPVSGTALPEATAFDTGVAPLALASGLDGIGGSGLTVAAEAAVAVVSVVVVVATVEPGTISPAGGATRSTWPTSRWFGSDRLFQRARSRQLWPVSMPFLVSMSPGWTVYVPCRDSAAGSGWATGLTGSVDSEGAFTMRAE